MCMMQGLVFGAGTDKGVVKLFDVRSYAQGPFDAFTVSLCCLMVLLASCKPLVHKVVPIMLPGLISTKGVLLYVSSHGLVRS